MAVRILATSMLYGNAVFELAEKLPELKLVEFRSAEWERLLPEAEALIITLNNVFTSEDILKAKKLKAIGTFSVGVNHLPLKLCEEKNIKIVNTPGVLTDATADISLALLLAVARRIVEADELVRNGEWKGWTPGFMLGTELSGKVCGIMGSGPIGQAVARRVHALGMKVVFWDREGSGKPVDFGYDVAERLPLDALLKISNVLSLNCPLTEQTKCLLSKVKL
ncbi:MAG: D-glycerate dehydrogenase, partial [Fibrobacteres bacterium]|nr:D-glycerate dehydrogenase [Fibrobacterota bacterium]